MDQFRAPIFFKIKRTQFKGSRKSKSLPLQWGHTARADCSFLSGTQKKHFCLLVYLLPWQTALPYAPAVDCPLASSHPMQAYWLLINGIRGIQLLECKGKKATGTGLAAQWVTVKNQVSKITVYFPPRNKQAVKLLSAGTAPLQGRTFSFPGAQL